jgi:hypothetical protein
LPWFIDHLCEVVPRRVAEPAFAVQIETKIIHYLRVSNQQLTDTPSPNVGTLLNQYLESVIRLRAEQLAGEMGELLSFVGQTFWLGPAGHLTFRPDPIDPDVCDAEGKQLDEKLAKTWDTYKAYRKVVKERLMI